MKYFCFVLSLLFIFNVVLYAQPDSLIEAYESALTENDKINAKIQIAYYYQDNKEYKTALEQFDQAMEIAKASNKEDYIADISYSKSYIYYLLEDYSNSLFYAQEAKTIYEEIDDSLNVGYTYNIIGVIYELLERRQEALDYFLKNSYWAKTVKDTLAMATSYNNIGLIYSHLGKDSLSLEYYKKSLKLYWKIGNVYDLGVSYGNISISYAELYDKDNSIGLEKSFEYAKKAEELYLAENDYHGLIQIYTHLGDIFWTNIMPDSSYKYLKKGIEISDKYDNETDKIFAYSAMGSYYLRVKDYENAKKYLDVSFNIAKKLNLFELISSISEDISRMYFEQNKYKQAYDYLKIYHEYKDSLDLSTSQQEMNIALLNYEFDKKIEKIEIEDQLKRLELENQLFVVNRKRNLLIFLVGIFVIFSSFIAYIFYLTKRKNRILSNQNNEILIKNKELDFANKEINGFFNNSIVGVIIIDDENRICRSNQKFAEIVGFSSENVKGMQITDLFNSQKDYLKFSQNIENQYRENDVFQIEYKFQLEKDETKWISISGSLLEGRDNHINQIWIIEDINDRIENLKQLKIFKKFIEQSDQGFAMAELDGQLLYANPALINIIGEGRLYNNNGWNSYPISYHELLKNTIIPRLRDNKSWRGEIELINNNNETINTIENFFPIISDNKHYICNAITDISKQKEVEQQLIHSRQRLSAILNYAPIGLDVVGLDGTILQVNKYFLKMVGKSEEELIGSSIFDILAENDKVFDSTKFTKLVEQKITIYRVEKKFISKSGKETWADLSVAPLLDEKKNLIALIGVFLDITKRKKAEEMLKLSFDNLHKAQDEIINLEKKNSAYAMAITANHEINQPLMIMKGSLEMLMMKHPELLNEQKSKEYLAKLEDSITRISKILDKFKDSNTYGFEGYVDKEEMVVFKEEK